MLMDHAMKLLLAVAASATTLAGGDDSSKPVVLTAEALDGNVVFLGEGHYLVPRPLVLREDTVVVGMGSGRTFLQAQRGGLGNYGALDIRGVDLWRADRPTETGTRAVGLMVEGRFAGEDIQLEGFTVGLYIYASASEFGTNANGWAFAGRVFGSAHAGVMVRGRDANGGSGHGIRVATSCERASAWAPTLGPCAGVVDRSFLGNGWSDLLIATTSERTGRGYVPLPPFRVDGDSNHSVFTHVYCETDQGHAYLSKAAMALGGLCGEVQGPGLRVDGPMFSGAEFVNDQQAGNTVRVRLGRSATPGSFDCHVSDAIDKSRPVCSQAVGRCYTDRIANQRVVGVPTCVP